MGTGYFLLRKALHALLGAVVLFLALELWADTTPIIFRWVLIGTLLLLLLLDYLRIELGIRLPLYAETEKPYEREHLHAMTLGAIGTVLAFLLFDFTIAIAALTMQYFGDPAAAIVGKYFGRTRLFRRKSLQGTLAMLLVSLGIGVAILESWKLALVMAMVAALTEAALDKLDDNLVVPLTAGAIGALFSVLWMVP